MSDFTFSNGTDNLVVPIVNVTDDDTIGEGAKITEFCINISPPANFQVEVSMPSCVQLVILDDDCKLPLIFLL